MPQQSISFTPQAPEDYLQTFMQNRYPGGRPEKSSITGYHGALEGVSEIVNNFFDREMQHNFRRFAMDQQERAQQFGFLNSQLNAVQSNPNLSNPAKQELQKQILMKQGQLIAGSQIPKDDVHGNFLKHGFASMLGADLPPVKKLKPEEMMGIAEQVAQTIGNKDLSTDSYIDNLRAAFNKDVADLQSAGTLNRENLVTKESYQKLIGEMQAHGRNPQIYHDMVAALPSSKEVTERDMLTRLETKMAYAPLPGDELSGKPVAFTPQERLRMAQMRPDRVTYYNPKTKERVSVDRFGTGLQQFRADNSAPWDGDKALAQGWQLYTQGQPLPTQKKVQKFAASGPGMAAILVEQDASGEFKPVVMTGPDGNPSYVYQATPSATTSPITITDEFGGQSVQWVSRPGLQGYGTPAPPTAQAPAVTAPTVAPPAVQPKRPAQQSSAQPGPAVAPIAKTRAGIQTKPAQLTYPNDPEAQAKWVRAEVDKIENGSIPDPIAYYAKQPYNYKQIQQEMERRGTAALITNSAAKQTFARLVQLPSAVNNIKIMAEAVKHAQEEGVPDSTIMQKFLLDPDGKGTFGGAWFKGKFPKTARDLQQLGGNINAAARWASAEENAIRKNDEAKTLMLLFGSAPMRIDQMIPQIVDYAMNIYRNANAVLSGVGDDQKTKILQRYKVPLSPVRAIKAFGVSNINTGGANLYNEMLRRSESDPQLVDWHRFVESLAGGTQPAPPPAPRGSIPEPGQLVNPSPDNSWATVPTRKK